MLPFYHILIIYQIKVDDVSVLPQITCIIKLD